MRTRKTYSMFSIFLIITILLESTSFITTVCSQHETNGDSTVSHLLITELYYYAHSRIPNEFITIYNPLSESKDISGWYITTKPEQSMSTQPKIIFSDYVSIPPYSSITLTQNATAFLRETGIKPNYEYDNDIESNTPKLATYKSVHFSNTQGTIALKDASNLTIDIVVYGNITTSQQGWVGPAINDTGSGVILKRNFKDDVPIDTDTALDWQHNRIYGIGQSDFPSQTFTVDAEITTFVSPDCSYETIASELQKATTSIYLNMYEFTNPSLFDELLKVLQRHVSLFIFMEGSPVGGITPQEKFILSQLATHGANIRFITSDSDYDVYARYPFDHAKYLVIDNTTVIVESCNWAQTGVPKDPSYGNREWGIVIRNNDIAGYFLQVFQDDWNPESPDSYPLSQTNLSTPPGFSLSHTIRTGSYIPQFQAQTTKGTFMITPVFSPDTSEQALYNLIESAKISIAIEQLYIYKDWDEDISPLVEQLIRKTQEGVTVKVILNYDPQYTSTNLILNETKQYLEENGVFVSFLYTNWSYFTTLHNKGMIIDNQTVLISSINWNEQSVRKNREAGIIIQNEVIAHYYADVFTKDWNLKQPDHQQQKSPVTDHKNIIIIGIILLIVIVIILRDWKRRRWN